MDSTKSRLEKAEGAIKTGWIAAIVSAVMTSIVAILAIVGDNAIIEGADAYLFIDVAILLGLAYGIYKKSRVCAGILFAYFLLSKAVQIMGGNTGGLIMGALFLFFYGRALWGTIVWRQLSRSVEQVEIFSEPEKPRSTLVRSDKRIFK